MAMSSTPQMIALFHQARDHGVDISTEVYPWDASVDQVRSVIFDDTVALARNSRGA
jgi:dihydroorotase